MNELISSFIQHIPTGGYQLANLKAFQLKAPIKNREEEALYWPTHASSSRNYQPLLDEPALFCKFSDLGKQPDGQQIKTFANHYGWLGTGELVLEPERQYSDMVEASNEVLSAEFTRDWRAQLLDFIPLLELWHALSSNDEHYLRSVITWQADFSSVAYEYKPLNIILIASSSLHTELLTTLTPGDVVAPAKILLMRRINERLNEHCSPALLFKDSTYQQPYLYFRCHNLMGVIWLQLATAVANNTVARRCAECNAPFMPTPSERGKKKRFCTDACKSKDYRRNTSKK